MKHAVIDLGSNTVRMSVFDVSGDKFQQVISEKEIVGLIGYTEKGILSPNGIIRVADAISEFKETADAVGASTLSCFATAGVRDIKNGEMLLERVLKETGINIQVISGLEEARLDFIGAWRPEGISEGLVVDMGGGSTEIVRYKNMEIENAISMPFGSLSLYKRFISKVMPNKEEREEIEEFIKKQLAPVEWLSDSAEHLTLIGGTARAIARLHRGQNARDEDNLHGYTFDAADLENLFDYVRHNKKEAMRNVFKVVPERIHTIVPGLMTFAKIISIAGCKTVSISRTGVREGYLKEYVIKEATE